MLINTELALHHFKQTEWMSNPEFQEELHELIEVYEHLGGEAGMSRIQGDALLAVTEFQLKRVVSILTLMDEVQTSNPNVARSSYTMKLLVMVAPIDNITQQIP